jgi:hypothetical protein
MSTHTERQTRRKVGLELVSLVASMGSAVFFSGLLVAQWSLRHAFVATVLATAGFSAYWIWHRSRYPANIAPPPAETVDDSADEDDGGRWEWYWILALVVSLIAVVVVGLVSSFLLALVVIVGFGVGYSDVSDVGDIASAALAMLAVAAIVEFGVVMPLCKRWNLDFDAQPEPRSTYCPTPTERS